MRRPQEAATQATIRNSRAAIVLKLGVGRRELPAPLSVADENEINMVDEAMDKRPPPRLQN
jgi:hypothetical protein